ncbi:MAG: hypothetical protein O2917_05665 [Acidobacteria bacterium]|nr:hypothetical protein [Acidobacteriota bacterium]
MGTHRGHWIVGGLVAVSMAACAFLAADVVAAQEPAASDVLRTPDGQPDMQGWWETDAYTPNLETGLADPVTAQLQGQPAPDPADAVSVIVDPADGRIPYQPWAAEIRDSIPSHRRGPTSTGVTETVRDVRPRTFCLHGMPRSGLYGFQLTQVPGYVILAWEFSHAYRVIPLTDRPHIAPNIKLVMGDSRGRWEGNTLVVDTTNVNDWDWFDYTGSFHSDAMTVVERFTVVDADTIDYQYTVTDPRVFTQPWTVAVQLTRDTQPDGYELWESACVEGERGVEGLLGQDPR